MTHPPVIRYETESRIENIEMANQNLAQIIMEETKINGEKPKKTVDLLKGRTPAPLTIGKEAGDEGNRGRRRRLRWNRPWGGGGGVGQERKTLRRTSHLCVGHGMEEESNNRDGIKKEGGGNPRGRVHLNSAFSRFPWAARLGECERDK